MEAPPPPEFFEIQHTQLTGLKDKVVIITGGSSGIGLATAQLCLDQGARVVVGDVNKCPIESDSLTSQQVDVRDWKSQTALFKKAIEVYGRVDHVFANAGISGVDRFVEDELDSNGDLLPPNMKTLDINLTGVIYTCKLGTHYLKKNQNGGSIVITASASSLVPFFLSDYGTSKHAVLGLMRALTQNLASTPNIRINCVTPMWTATALVDGQRMEKELNMNVQGPEVVARSVGLLMADEERRGQTIYSVRGKYKNVEDILLAAAITNMGIEQGDLPDPTKAGEMLELLRHKG